MEIQETIGELKHSLEHSIDEEVLLRTITDDLTAMRDAFAGNRGLFTPDHIEFLRSLTPISHRLHRFIDIKEELGDVASEHDCVELINRLLDIKKALAPFAVCKRVGKEIRELNERLPSIRRQEDDRQQWQVSIRAIELEADAPRCPRKHAMVIRKGGEGYFWGCSQYPWCMQTKRLTAEQEHRLRS
jgi:hypothetical protein